MVSLFGDIRLSCSYYHCGPCGTSQQPWDAALRLGTRRVTAGAEEAITLAGLLTSFGRAAGLKVASMASRNIVSGPSLEIQYWVVVGRANQFVNL